MIKTKKILHHEEDRLFIIFPYNKETITKVRTLNDARWSATHSAWHLPYTPNDLKEFAKIFPQVMIDGEQNNEKSITEIEEKDSESNRLVISDKKIYIYAELCNKDIGFLNKFKYYRWSHIRKCFELPNFGNNLDKIRQYFGGRLEELTQQTILTSSIRENTANTSLVISTPDYVHPYISKFRKWLEHKRYS
ncbi:MAG: hypothetical protein PHE33_11375, partial [Bacteroidales bacterium]|nr:hypothetical protein [Bacteroidales bacterium]